MNEAQELFTQKLYGICTRCGVAELLTPARADAFFRLFLLLLEENEKYNLTAVTERDRVILLHYADSLAAAAHLPQGASVIDVGCGAGFPSLPLALCRPDLQITAADATAKKIVFVTRAAAMLGLPNVTGKVLRAEVAGHAGERERYDICVARAVAALPVLVELCTPLVRVGGQFLAMKGKNAGEEAAAARHAIGEMKCKVTLTKEYKISDGVEELSRTIFLLEKTAPTPGSYPRPFSRILARPL